MHARGRKDRRGSIEEPSRSRIALIAVVAWWVAVLSGALAWQLLNRSLADPPARWQARIGTWLAGFAILGQLIGIGAAIGAVLRDRGRVRVGAALLLLLPVTGVVAIWIGVSSTVVNPIDLLMPAWLVIGGTVLLIGSLLIVVPARLGLE